MNQQLLSEYVYEQVVRDLTTQQHLHPHAPVLACVQDVCRPRGFAPGAVQQVLADSDFHLNKAVGRISRKELHSLAKVIGCALQGQAAQSRVA